MAGGRLGCGFAAGLCLEGSPDETMSMKTVEGAVILLFPVFAKVCGLRLTEVSSKSHPIEKLP